MSRASSSADGDIADRIETTLDRLVSLEPRVRKLEKWSTCRPAPRLIGSLMTFVFGRHGGG